MANFNISKAKKKQDEEVKNQKHADFFLIARESYTKSLCLKAKRLINTFTERFLKNFEKVLCVRDQTSKTSWVLHHDNAPCRTAISVNRFLARKNIPVAPQPLYSPDLSPCDFFLFPKLKNHLKGHHFGTLENIQTAVTDQLKAIPISEFHQCYEEWKKRLQRCVTSEGSYFEGDNVEL
ncbi:putative transposase [Trichonephila clavipes]|nr:putative transposase [Trichonephila clavipes]